jgi:hypothetical protein
MILEMLGYALSYTIDADDMLVGADESFFSFASQNLWTGAEASIGRPLWDFVSGPAVQRAQRSLLSRVRETGRPIRLAFRCDAPALRREMTMAIHPGGADGTVTFSTWVDWETIRPAQALIDPRPSRCSGWIEMCAWCDRFRADGRWCEVEAATRTLEATAGDQLPRISHRLCDACTETLASP